MLSELRKVQDIHNDYTHAKNILNGLFNPGNEDENENYLAEDLTMAIEMVEYELTEYMEQIWPE